MSESDQPYATSKGPEAVDKNDRAVIVNVPRRSSEGGKKAESDNAKRPGCGYTVGGGQPAVGCPTTQPRYTKSSDANYEETYAPDPCGEELSSNARVWCVYNDEAQMADRELVKSLNGTIDTLFLFAGLFSAVVTTFVAQSSLKLEPDYAKITSSLVYEQVLRQRAAAAGATVGNVPQSQLSFSSETYETSDLWVNGLWLTSLTLSLSTALVSVLAKQWIQYFSSTSGNTAQERAHIRQYRLEGFKQWRVPFIIDFLPILLSVALLLFLAGLAVYTSSVNTVISRIVIGFSSSIALVFAATIILPIFVTQCPYKTPIADHLMAIPYWLYSLASRRISDHRKEVNIQLDQRRSYFQDCEAADVKRQPVRLTDKALGWLCLSSSNPSATTLSLHATFAYLMMGRTDHDEPGTSDGLMNFFGVRLLPSPQVYKQERYPDDVAQDVTRIYSLAYRYSEKRPGRMHRLWRRVQGLLRGRLELPAGDEANFWTSTAQMARWKANYRELEDISEPGLREVVRFVRSVREPLHTAQMQSVGDRVTWRQLVSRYRFRLILDAVDALLPCLPDLLLHPIVWRDIDVAVAHLLSSHELQPHAAALGDTYRLTGTAKGNPLGCTPIFLVEYAEEREWKEGQEVMVRNMEELQRLLGRYLKNTKLQPEPSTEPQTGRISEVPEAADGEAVDVGAPAGGNGKYFVASHTETEESAPLLDRRKEDATKEGGVQDSDRDDARTTAETQELVSDGIHAVRYEHYTEPTAQRRRARF